jgi:hypothetical protein
MAEQEAQVTSHSTFEISPRGSSETLKDYHDRMLDTSDRFTFDELREYCRKRDHESSAEYQIRQRKFSLFLKFHTQLILKRSNELNENMDRIIRKWKMEDNLEFGKSYLYHH